MNYRRSRNYKVIKNKNIFVSIISLLLVLGLALLISSNLANLIYKRTILESNSDNVKEIGLNNINSVNDKLTVEETENTENYVNDLAKNNLVVFQGGVFNDLENAEEFKNNIENLTLASIVNDGKYERIILGIANKENFLEMVNLFKKNNIQFVRNNYKIPLSVEYNSEILKIVNEFSDFIIRNLTSLSSGVFNTKELKQTVKNIEADYGKIGSYKIFEDLKDLILELDDETDSKELESVLDYVYINFDKYKI